jgi:hypothetical protein
MQIEDIKTWQWTVIGLLIGLLFGGVLLWKGPWFDAENLDTTDQGTFERQLIGLPPHRPVADLIERFHKNLPLIKDLTVHPPLAGDSTKTYWVTGKSYTIVRERKNLKDLKSPLVDIERWDPFKFQAKTPYTATIGAPGEYPTVVEYLRAVQKQPSAKFTFKVAWWDTPALTLILPAVAGVLMIGLAWPLALGLMQGVGLARPTRQKKVKLPKNRPAPAQAAVDSSAGEKQLDDLNAELEKSLAGFASGSSPVDQTDDAGPSPIKPLTGTDGAATATNKNAEEDDLIREYGGEFYPVAKKVHKG